MAPTMKQVEKAGIKGLKMKRNPVKVSVDDFFHESDQLRSTYSRLIENDDSNRVVIIPSVSYGLANVAHNIPFKDGEILLAAEQFPSNVYPWMRLKEKGFELQIVSPPESKSRGESWNEKILEAINPKTRLVAIGHIHWSDGTLFQLKSIREKLDKVGGLLVIDGTQSVGALPFSVKEIRPDALVCAGYKWLMGPYSIGLAYYGSAFDGGTPIEESWINRLGSDDFDSLINYQEAYREKALRYEVGEHSNFILVPMLHQAVKQLVKWSPQNIQQYTSDLMEKPIKEIKEMGYRIEDDAWRSSHLFGVRLPANMDLVKFQRSFKKHRVCVSVRGDSIRISPNIYNDEMDVRKLLKAMKEPIFAS